MSVIQNAGMATIVLAVDQGKLGSGLASAQDKIKRFSAQVSEMSSKLTAIAFVASQPLSAAVRTFAAFDDQMRMVSAVTGSTGNEFAALTDRAKTLGRTTSFMAKEVAEGMLSLGRMGFAPAEIMDSIDDIMNLARATGTSLGDAALIAANNMRVFGIDATKASDVADILAVTANASAQNLTDLGESLKMAGPHAAGFNESLLDTSAALGVLANMGIKGSMAGTALSRSFVQMTNPAIKARLNGFGVATEDSNKNLRKMKDILTDVAIAMSGMGTSEAGEFIQDIFNMRGALGGGVLVGNIEQIEKMNAKLKKFADEAKRMKEIAEAGLGGSLNFLKSSAEGVALAFGETLGNAFLPVIKGLTSLGTTTANVISQFSWLIKTLVIMASIPVGLGAAFKMLSVGAWTLKAIGAPVMMLTTGLGRLRMSFMAASASAHALTRPIAMLTIGQNGAIVTGHRYVAMNYRMAVANKMLASSLGGLGQAFKAVFATNAFTVLFSAVVIAFSYAANAIRKLEERFTNLIEEAKQAESKAETNTDSGTAKNKNALGMFTRLKTLAEMSKLRELTDEEMKQAEALTDQLKDYGSAAFTFANRAGKSFSLSTDAAEKFGNAVRDNAVASLEEESAALQKHIDILQQRKLGLRQKLSDGDRSDGNMAYLFGGFEKDSAEFDKVKKELDELEKRRAELAMKTEAMRSASVEEATGSTSGETIQQQINAAYSEMDNLKKAATEANDEIKKVFAAEVRSGKSAVENEISDVIELEEKYRVLAKTQRDFILAEARHAYLSGDRDAVAAKMAGVNAIDAQTDAYMRMTVARRKAIEEKSAKGFLSFLGDEDKKISKRIAVDAGEDAFGDLIDGKQFDTLSKFMNALNGSINAMRDAYTRTLASATDSEGSGGAAITDAEKEALDAIKESISEAMNKSADYRQKIDSAKKGTEAANRSSNGTYSADKFFARLGASNEQDAKRTAKATEGMERKLYDLYTYLVNNKGSLVIGG